MRIAFANWSCRLAGGAEGYVGTVARGLGARGHELALVHEVDAPLDRPPIPLPHEAPRWDASVMGVDGAVAAVSEWLPDVLFVHGLDDPTLHRRLAAIAPTVFLAHNYYGTCISGAKAYKFPTVRPCPRSLGLGCLLRYYPRRTGGLHPGTMWRLYRMQRARLRVLAGHEAVATLSRHMRAEYLRHGLDPHRVHQLPFPAPPTAAALDVQAGVTVDLDTETVRLLFAGRMDPLKGGQVLLGALPQIAAAVGRPVHLTLAGDGPDRARWESRARKLHDQQAGVRTSFVGWALPETLISLFDTAHLLVVPSLWPEPLGLVGLEAGFRALPVAAFGVGGIPEWLQDGVNGHVAPGDPPTVSGLAAAVAASLSSSEHYARLRRGAREMARRLSMDEHLTALESVLETASRRPQ